MRDFTMRDAVNDYLEASGANRPFIGDEETILAHRKIAANRRTKHGQSVERCSNTMPCKEEEEDTQPTNEAWAECRAMLEHYAMQGGGRGHSTDWRLTASMFCPKRSYSRRTGSWRGLWGICQSKGLVFTDSETYKSSPFALLYSLS